MFVMGRVVAGKIVLEGDALLPDGARVRIELLEDTAPIAVKAPDQESTLYDRLKHLAGVVEGLPADFAAKRGRTTRD